MGAGAGSDEVGVGQGAGGNGDWEVREGACLAEAQSTGNGT